MKSEKEPVSVAMVVIAFITIYLVWGSTYFFIQQAVKHIPPMIMGTFRFLIAGSLLLGWSYAKGETIGNLQQIKPAVVSGLLLLLVGNGAVMWAEKTLPSSLVAVLLSSTPIWFVLLDRPKWQENFKSRTTMLGIFTGFTGVILLLKEKASEAFSMPGFSVEVFSLLIILLGALSWAGGSIYFKYNSKGSSNVNSGWQMLAAGLVFFSGSLITYEWRTFDWNAVTMGSWLSLVYLILMGSLAGYSAYVWLLKVRPAVQVSTYAYVNPLIAVLLGVLFAGEHFSGFQTAGFIVILGSVLLINLSKYRSELRRIRSQSFRK
jgi:drug/metabolite transporter (DMT)-like permease